jgi:nitrogen fixation protein FixH
MTHRTVASAPVDGPPRAAAARRVVLVLCLALAACSGGRAEDPHSILRAYSRALEEGRSEDAYRMLSEEARRGISLEAFRRMVKDNPEEVREIARSLGRPTATPVVTATVTSANGQELQLVLEKGRWKVEATAIDLYAQDTPRHAIQGFVRAVERRRYDVVLKYVPDAHKEGLDAGKLKLAWEGHDKEEIQQVVAALKQALPSATIEETGDRASMPYSQGTMQLLRERGLWKIEDFD